MTSVRQAITYFLLGAIALGCGIGLYFEDVGRQPILWWLLVWPALVLWLIAYWYLMDSHQALRVIAKDPATGDIPTGTFLLLFPYFFVAIGWWFIRHKLILERIEDPYNLVAENIYVGRYPIHFPSQFPVSARGVVDLTAEWPSRIEVTRGRNYICLPAMDCDMPRMQDLIDKARTVADEWEGGVYVHCANGHGRSSCFAALVMLFRGMCPDWKTAFAEMKKQRKYINIQGPQIAMMNEIQAIIQPELDARRGL